MSQNQKTNPAADTVEGEVLDSETVTLRRQTIKKNLIALGAGVAAGIAVYTTLSLAKKRVEEALEENEN